MKDTFKIFVEIVNLADSLKKLGSESLVDRLDARDKFVDEAVEHLLQKNVSYQDALNELELLNGMIDDGGFYQNILNHASKKIKGMAMNTEV